MVRKILETILFVKFNKLDLKHVKFRYTTYKRKHISRLHHSTYGSHIYDFRVRVQLYWLITSNKMQMQKSLSGDKTRNENSKIKKKHIF